MINAGDKIVVAVSGGPDSVCLLKILSQLRKLLDTDLIVAHLDHGLRPNEDEKETEFVANLARRLNLTFACNKVSNLPKTHGASIEEKAREARYQFLTKVLDKHHAQKIALGHNMNDQAETVLMHILRGTGSTGLSGILPIRENRFIRPLINVTRDEIHTYLKQKNTLFIMDSSNLEKKYLRNKIRLELIPVLLEYQPGLIRHLGELAFLCRQENQFMEEEARKGLQTVILDSTDHSLGLSLSTFKNFSLPLQYRIIRQAIKRVKGNLRRIDIGHVRAIMGLINNSRPQIKINLPDNLIIKKSYTKLRFSSGIEIETKNFSYHIKNMGRFQIQEINQTILLEEISKKDFLLPIPSPQEAFLDLDRIRWPLRVRNFKPGDRFMPFGLNGFKKVKDIFIDNKIPFEERKKIVILESGNNIVWVCGIRIDNRYRVKRATKRILRCNIE